MDDIEKGYTTKSFMPRQMRNATELQLKVAMKSKLSSARKKKLMDAYSYMPHMLAVKDIAVLLFAQKIQMSLLWLWLSMTK